MIDIVEVENELGVRRYVLVLLADNTYFTHLEITTDGSPPRPMWATHVNDAAKYHKYKWAVRKAEEIDELAKRRVQQLKANRWHRVAEE